MQGLGVSTLLKLLARAQQAIAQAVGTERYVIFCKASCTMNVPMLAAGVERYLLLLGFHNSCMLVPHMLQDILPAHK